MKILFLNGPPRAGKDTVGNALRMRFPGCEVAKFAGELKDAVHRAFNLNVPTDYFESRKDQPCPEFFGQTPRAAYIAFSERFMKPLYGQGVFGRLLVQTLQGMEEAGVKLVAVTDSGFREEADEVLKVYPEALLVRLHRAGTSFMGDSRSYIQLGIEAVDMHNDTVEAPNAIAEFAWNALMGPQESAR
jgi:hypothetical protein